MDALVQDPSAFVELIVARLEERLAMRFGGAMPYDPVWAVCDAMRYAGKRSAGAFYRWAKLRGVNACSHGQYRKSELDRCLSLSQKLVSKRRRAAA